MISIFTDASVKKHQVASGCCIVLTDSNFMGCDTTELGNAVPQVAEIRACINAVKYAQKVCPNFDNEDIVLYCDNATVVKIISAKKYNGPLKEELQPLKELVTRFNINVQYIKGHQIQQTNPNIAVDSILRAQ